MRKASLPVLLLALLGALLIPATAAHAHAVFPDPTPIQAGTTKRVLLQVPHERDDSFWNERVEVAVPSGWVVTGCDTKPTWTCDADAVVAGVPAIVWEKAASAGPAEDENFWFTVRAASTVGTYAFPTIQIYSDGEEAEWIGDSSSDHPAPVLRTVPRTSAPTTTLPTVPPPTHTPTSRPTGPSPTSPDPTVAPGPGPGPGGPAPTVAPPDGPGGAPTTTRPGATTTTSDRTDTTDEDGTSTTTDGDDERDGSPDGEPSDGGGDGEIEAAGGPGLGAADEDAEERSSSGLVVLVLVVLAIGGAGAALFLRQRAVNRRTAADDA
jgi:hypothetical protein